MLIVLASWLDDTRYYSTALGGHVQPYRPPEQPRDDQAWAAARRELLRFRRGRTAVAYLRGRGIEPRAHDLAHTTRRGYPAIVARCYVGDEVATEAFLWYASRPPGRKAKGDVLRRRPERGTGWIGGPVPPSRDDQIVLLVAGFLDGFSARQRGFDAVSAIGTSLPQYLVDDLAGRIVAVAYDVGEERAAAKNAAKLREAECEAFVVRLGRIRLSNGRRLPPGGDVTDYFAADGSSRQLQRLIDAERRRTS